VDNIPWTLKYRPHSFTEVTGQRAPRLVLRRMVDKGDVRPALLFFGSHGSGKTSMARILAAALNCEAEEPTARPCGGCAVCVSTAEGRASDVTEIDAASSGLASDMRALREAVRSVGSLSCGDFG
jgi:DNA polymerase-3 subunit gamma/tau